MWKAIVAVYNNPKMDWIHSLFEKFPKIALAVIVGASGYLYAQLITMTKDISSINDTQKELIIVIQDLQKVISDHDAVLGEVTSEINAMRYRVSNDSSNINTIMSDIRDIRDRVLVLETTRQ